MVCDSAVRNQSRPSIGPFPTRALSCACRGLRRGPNAIGEASRSPSGGQGHGASPYSLSSTPTSLARRQRGQCGGVILAHRQDQRPTFPDVLPRQGEAVEHHGGGDPEPAEVVDQLGPHPGVRPAEPAPERIGLVQECQRDGDPPLASCRLRVARLPRIEKEGRQPLRERRLRIACLGEHLAHRVGVGVGHQVGQLFESSRVCGLRGDFQEQGEGQRARRSSGSLRSV